MQEKRKEGRKEGRKEEMHFDGMGRDNVRDIALAEEDINL